MHNTSSGGGLGLYSEAYAGGGSGSGISGGIGASSSRVPRSFGSSLTTGPASASSPSSRARLLLNANANANLAAANATANAASPGTNTLLMNDESERLLNEGLTIVQEAFDRRTAVLHGELLEWRQNSNTQREQINNLESENKSLQLRISELESVIQSQQADLQTLSEAKNLITEKYNILKKSAAQLDSFRKNIVSMVEYGPAMQSALNAMDLNQSFNLTGEHSDAPTSGARLSPTQRQFSSSSRSSQQNNSHMENVGANFSGQTPTSPRRIVNPLDYRVGQQQTHHHQQLQQQQQQYQRNYNTLLEGPSFLNANDLKSFELSSQTLDYSLAFPDRYNQQGSASKPIIGGSAMNYSDIKQTEEPEQQQLPPTQQHQQQHERNQQYQQQQEVTPSSSLPPKIVTGGSGGGNESGSASSLNNLKQQSSLSTPNLSQLGARKIPRQSSGTGDGALSSSSPSNNNNNSNATVKGMQHQQIQRTLDRVNRRTMGESPSSTDDPRTRGTPATTSMTTPTSKQRPQTQPQQHQDSTGPVDAPTLYKQIRDALSQPEFEAFAGYVAGFNAGELTADEAVKNIGRIVKDKGLFGRMRTLIYTALAESARNSAT
ncbi:hypothetical protein BCR33DRAFT_712176 [Rhizoclosmatium globosum]|uniref:Uncharacterized protein n=1 Tax=Rhizoclosmatium globosum TaxID=329046 RepID=A0A1Y2CY59_9FUNG|nr:hypothetical protein BCR33DRAFT_712176 [Rhizoclosmatium globosum]|eukprot:ORY51971.1 hypothetical protein BCR33DRAFT_712176 [Rhizoclosmatium globosum]